MRRPVLAAATAAAVLSLVTRGDAATPTFWHVSTQAEFLRGEVENLSIDSDGRLLLGPEAELVADTSAPFLWTLVRGADGALWVGSGNEGKVFRVAGDGATTTFFDAAELEVHALAPAPDGGLYVGTSPEGKIYRVDRTGAATTLFDPEDKYIWALAVDREGAIYAATGDKGGVYRITPDGKGEMLYRTRATHVVALAFDREGRLLAGTESPGQVLRIDRTGRAFVLLDSPFREIHALKLDGSGVVYAAAVSGQPPIEERPPERPLTEPARPAPVPTVSTEITAISIGDASVTTSPQSAGPRREDRRSPRGGVYRIAPDGLWDLVWESTEDMPYDLKFDAAGALVIGTGSKGKIYHVAGDPAKATLLTRAAAQQLTSFLRDAAGRTYYATSNPGKVYRLSSERASRGTYESEVRDAATVATWGTIRWRALTPAGTRVQLFTRSGNTSKPDETWSPWSEPYDNANGEQISSPKARYLQWRAVLTGTKETPVLTSVTAAYLQRNLRPEVASITVHPAGTVFQKPFSTGELEIAGYEDRTSDGRPPTPGQTPPPGAGAAPALGRRVYQKGLQTFAWKATDANEDRLQFDVLYRREGETTWTTLRSSLWDPIFVWDTTSVPDGTYVVKIVASDVPANSPGTALSGELESTTFDIDNTPPRIEVGRARAEGSRTVLPFVVRDEQSPIQRVEYSLDANRWRVVYPKDGIPDSRAEEFEIALAGDVPAKSVIVRATDAMENTATAVGELVTAGKR